MRHSLEKIVPHCIFCKKDLKAGQFVFMDGINGIVHANCSNWKKDFIKDKGAFEVIVKKYPHYFRGFKV
jgi:hypothetical protein